MRPSIAHSGSDQASSAPVHRQVVTLKSGRAISGVVVNMSWTLAVGTDTAGATATVRKDVQDIHADTAQTDGMAFIRVEFDVEADCAAAWQVIGDWEAGPVGMAPGFVVSSEATGDVRVVTFADGFVARERLVSRDEGRCRIAYSLTGDAGPVHDNAVMEVVAAGPRRCRFLWSRDVLPDEAAGPLRAVMHEAAPIITSALERLTVG